MAIFGKKDKDKKDVSVRNEAWENELVVGIDTAQVQAEGGTRADIETDWDDEYKIYIGKQWDTSKGLRSSDGKTRNFNSQDNYIFSTIQNMRSAFAETPVIEIRGEEESDDAAGKVLTDLIATIFKRNEFPEQYDKIVLQMIQYGPVIGYVPWEQHRMGGTGPNRWVGEVGTYFLKKSEFFPDPAILDLEERLQECSFINIKKRKKIHWFAETWKEKGKFVIEDMLDIPAGQEDEGNDPKQATLIIHFHKGTPKKVSGVWKKDFLQKAEEAEAEGLPYKAQDYRDMAAGILKGVHCAYKAGSILLDYIPYIYEDGLYPFSYKVLYADEQQPYGMGEERNIVIPQILHNKADEIELGAMLGQGLGGWFYEKGALSGSQRNELLDTIAKPNACNEVNNLNGIKPKPTVQVPSSITAYKESKKIAMDRISRNTSILQGESIGANTPLGVVRELGARADASTVYRAKVLERFTISFVKLIINRILQFYTEDRKYRVLGNNKANIEKQIIEEVTRIANMPQGTPPEQQIQAMIQLLMFAKGQTQAVQQGRTATFNKRMLVRTWDRDTDEQGMPMKEEYIPEFDLKIKIVKEEPTDRNWYVNLAIQLLGKALGVKSFWQTINDGRFPPPDDIIDELEQMKKEAMQAQMGAVQVQAQAETEEAEKDRQASMVKQRETNKSQIQMTAISAMGKRQGAVR